MSTREWAICFIHFAETNKMKEIIKNLSLKIPGSQGFNIYEAKIRKPKESQGLLESS